MRRAYCTCIHLPRCALSPVLKKVDLMRSAPHEVFEFATMALLVRDNVEGFTCVVPCAHLDRKARRQEGLVQFLW